MLSAVALLGASGCSIAFRPNPRPMLDTVSATKVEIVAPLSQPTSLDEDDVPDGFVVVLKTSDAQGEPVKIAGTMLFELYSYRPAAADPKGRLIQTWNHTLETVEDQASYWNRMTRMYEFPLMVGDTTIPRKDRFVVVARYTDPWDDRLEDQVELDVSEYTASLKRRLSQSRR